MRRRCSHVQPDLFHLSPPEPQLRPEESREVLPLVQDLLREILSGLTADAADMEGGDE